MNLLGALCYWGTSPLNMQLPEFSATDVEEEELLGVLSGEKYIQLLFHYLIHNELLHAKFLWKRISNEVKQEDVNGAELTRTWQIATMLLKKNYIPCYVALKGDWSEIAKPMVSLLRANLQSRMLNLVARSYTSIHIDTFCSIVDMTPEDAVGTISQKGWYYDAASKMLMPSREILSSIPPVNAQKELSLLSDYVSFLEN